MNGLFFAVRAKSSQNKSRWEHQRLRLVVPGQRDSKIMPLSRNKTSVAQIACHGAEKASTYVGRLQARRPSHC